jgi:hypothetical protein
LIPEADRDSIYVNNNMMYCELFIGTNHCPVGKYFFLQSGIASVDEAARRDIIAHFCAAEPKWIISDIEIDHQYSLISFAVDNYRLVRTITSPDSGDIAYIYQRR